MCISGFIGFGEIRARLGASEDEWQTIYYGRGDKEEKGHLAQGKAHLKFTDRV